MSCKKISAGTRLATRPLKVVHHGSVRTLAYNYRTLYFVTSIDDYSTQIWVLLIKDQALFQFKRFRAFVTFCGVVPSTRNILISRDVFIHNSLFGFGVSNWAPTVTISISPKFNHQLQLQSSLAIPSPSLSAPIDSTLLRFYFRWEGITKHQVLKSTFFLKVHLFC